jgi:hypothetical protein
LFLCNSRLIFIGRLLFFYLQSRVKNKFFIFHFIWASRFATFGGSRRAIRSITRRASAGAWFRYYPSR